MERKKMERTRERRWRCLTHEWPPSTPRDCSLCFRCAHCNCVNHSPQTTLPTHPLLLSAHSRGRIHQCRCPHTPHTPHPQLSRGCRSQEMYRVRMKVRAKREKMVCGEVGRRWGEGEERRGGTLRSSWQPIAVGLTRTPTPHSHPSHSSPSASFQSLRSIPSTSISRSVCRVSGGNESRTPSSSTPSHALSLPLVETTADWREGALPP